MGNHLCGCLARPATLHDDGPLPCQGPGSEKHKARRLQEEDWETQRLVQIQSYLHERAAVKKCNEWVATTTTAKGATQQPTTPTPSCLSQDETRHVASPQQDIGCDSETFVLDNSTDMEVHVNNKREVLSQIALNRSSITGLPLEDSTEWTVGSLSRVCMLRTFLEGNKKRPQQPHLDDNEESRRRNVRTTLHSSIEPSSEGVFHHVHTSAAREILKSRFS